jgi:ribosome-associated protein
MTDHHDDDQIQGPSRSARKREAAGLQQLGETLTTLTAEQLRSTPISAALRDAIQALGRMDSHGARRRQMQLIGRLMRQEDADGIRTALARFDQTSAVAIAAHHQAERWRERLLLEGNAALTEFLAQQPAIDRQRLRQLIQAAQQEQATGAPARHARELFRLIRSAIDTAAV